ncbi:MAG: hypothetical protein AMJ79_00470 [Phycisphaerae bacterium SM23_30]|nr:MAG: hypothetical protein AMJ79_00470 [Phycisphaerae bacterium SM23_30]
MWRVKPAWQGRRQLAAKLHVPELVAQLLYNRGISEWQEARQFLQPSLNDMFEPQHLTGIDTAVKRINRALTDGEKIVLYGDYDVDGIAGVAILWHCLKLAGIQVDYYVPHRIEEGYGLNTKAIRRLAEKGAQLVVTVDCGISTLQCAEMAADLGVDLIITDHHQPEDKLPKAAAIVHPNLPGGEYPNKSLCGAGVALKLAWALAQKFSGAQKVSSQFREFLISATGLAALGTIADVVPLQGENRVLARFGLEGLAASKDTGIKALIEAAGLTGARLDSFDIGFKLAPRLNAAGRMGHARLAVELFTRAGAERAREIAQYLESQNRRRQKVEKETAAQALQQVADLGMDSRQWRGIVTAGQGWHGGVIGIVASRIVDKYHRPTVVISQQDDKVMGSCRSIEGFDICQALEACREHLLEFGGHEMAAGLSLKPDKIEAFRNAFNNYTCQHLSEKDLIPTLEIDAEIDLTELDLKTVEIIEHLGPFGAGNPQVMLVARDLRLMSPPRRIGSQSEHLQLHVAGGDDHQAHLRPGGVIRAVAFGKAGWEKKLLDADTFDLVFEPVINRFNLNITVEMIARDIRLS